MEKSKISMVISILLRIMLIVGIICLFLLPKLYDIFSGDNVLLFNNHSIYYRKAFYLCYIISLIIIEELNRLFSYLYRENPFQNKNVIILKIVAVLFMCLFFIISIKIIFIPTILSVAVSLISFIASLSFYVLSQVLKSGIDYKDEVDGMV